MSVSFEQSEPLLSTTGENGPSYDGVEYNNVLPDLEREVNQDDLSTPASLPPDRFGLTYSILFLQGIGMLLPWNSFITDTAYFNYKYVNDSTISRIFESAFSVGATVPNLLSLFLNVFLTRRVSRNLRLVTSLTVTLLCLVVTAVFVGINTAAWTKEFFGLTMVTIIIVNFSCGITQSSFFGIGGFLGPRYTQALMNGQAVAGLFAAVANILALIAGGSEEKTAFAYFLSAVAVLIACLITFFVLFALPFVKAHINWHDSIRSVSVQIVNQDVPNVLSDDRTPYSHIFYQISRMAFSVCFVFFVTLSLFPAVCSRIQSTQPAETSRWAKDFFVPVVCFLIFNTCDLTGRCMAGIIQFPGREGPWLPALCLARVVFIPLFALCKVQQRHQTSTVIFNHDAYPILFMTLFGLSNGYLGSLCMMYGPKFVSAGHTEIAGTVMVFFLTLGLALGAGFSFVLLILI